MWDNIRWAYEDLRSVDIVVIVVAGILEGLWVWVMIRCFMELF